MVRVASQVGRGRAARRPSVVARRAAALAAEPATRSAMPSVAGEFAARVAGSLEGPILTYTRRRQLLAEAERMGLGRFEANLVIATVLHRAGDTHDRAVVTEGASKWNWVAVALLAEGAVMLAAWIVLT